MLNRYKLIKGILEPIFAQSPGLIWYDVGAGGSKIRDRLQNELKKSVVTWDGDLDTEPYLFVDGQFDIITHLEVIEHLYNPLYHLTELRRILSANGVIYMTTPADDSWWYKIEHMLGRKYGQHFHQFGIGDIARICQRAGLKPIQIELYKRGTGRIARFFDNTFLITLRKSTPMEQLNEQIQSEKEYEKGH